MGQKLTVIFHRSRPPSLARNQVGFSVMGPNISQHYTKHDKY